MGELLQRRAQIGDAGNQDTKFMIGSLTGANSFAT